MPTLEAVRIEGRDMDHGSFRDVAAFYNRDGRKRMAIHFRHE